MSKIGSLFRLFGFNPQMTVAGVRGVGPFVSDLREFKRQAQSRPGEFRLGKTYPCLADRFTDAGSAKGDYFHQDIMVARRILHNAPKRHIDIGSRIDGFVSHVAVFREIEVFDVRPLTTFEPNIHFRQKDIMVEPDSSMRACTDSLSCLHTLEHFGLGRYGDPIDFDGHKKGLRNMIAMLQTGGRFYLSVPIGPQRIEFNGHRIFSPQYILDLAGSELRLDRFSYIDDAGKPIIDPVMDSDQLKKAFGCNFGIGIFEFIKT